MQSQIVQIVDELIDKEVINRILVAYSGGVDSSVLLHSVMQCFSKSKIKVIAVHVNHGLNIAATDWEQFCQRSATQMGADFCALHVDATANGGCSPEEAARNVRYAALKPLVQDGDVLMMAHHQDDQAETVLLQLLRGSGPDGLSAMPMRAHFSCGHIMRPLLAVTSSQINLYAQNHHLEWIDDPANDNLNYDRNYLRQKIEPLLCERWPGWRETLARAARHQADASQLIWQLAKQRYSYCCSSDDTLLVEACLNLGEAERKSVLRYWIKKKNLPLPSEKQLLQLIAILSSGGAGALVCWPGAEIRHYRGRLYAMAPRPPFIDKSARHWVCGSDLELPEIKTKLTWQRLSELAPDLSQSESLTVRWRCGGEQCFLGHFHKRLKKVFQELGVPPWERDRVPLIYLKDELRLVWYSPV